MLMTVGPQEAIKKQHFCIRSGGITVKGLGFKGC